MAPLEPIERRWLDGVTWLDRGPRWLAGADALLAALAPALDWRTRRRPMYGALVDEPRLHATLDPGALRALPILGHILTALRGRYGVNLSPGPVNYYRDGCDSVAWHSDRVGTGRPESVVALVSLGGPRRFDLRPKTGGVTQGLVLHSGDLLVMGGACQRRWEHRLPKVKSAGPRISLSFRPAGGAGPSTDDAH